MKSLTKRQAEILAYLKEHIETKGYAPSIREMCDAFRLRSLATGFRHLENLRKKGYIARHANHARALEIGATPVSQERALFVAGFRAGVFDSSLTADEAWTAYQEDQS